MCFCKPCCLFFIGIASTFPQYVSYCIYITCIWRELDGSQVRDHCLKQTKLRIGLLTWKILQVNVIQLAVLKTCLLLQINCAWKDFFWQFFTLNITLLIPKTKASLQELFPSWMLEIGHYWGAFRGPNNDTLLVVSSHTATKPWAPYATSQYH